MSNYFPPTGNITGSNPSPPYGVITPTNHGPYVVIPDYIMMSLMIVVVISRGLTLSMTNRPLVHHDYIIPAATLLAIAQSITVHNAVDSGLGQHRDALSDEQFFRYSKINYASQLLYLAVIVLAKLGLLLFVFRLTPSKQTVQVCRGVIVFICVWGLGATFAIAFQCKLPQPWNFTPGRCIDQSALYYFNGAVSIITDAFIMIVPVFIVWSIRISRRERTTVIAMFALRVAVCITSIIRLCYYAPYFQNSSDQTWENVNPSIWTQVDMNLGIMTACIPLLKPFLDKIPSGVMDTRNTLHASSQLYASDPSSGRRSHFKHPLGGDNKSKRENVVVAELGQNHGSDTALTEDAIRQTTEFRLEVDEDYDRKVKA